MNWRNFTRNKISRTDLSGRKCVLQDTSPGSKIKNACARTASKIRVEPEWSCSRGLASKGAHRVDIAL